MKTTIRKITRAAKVLGLSAVASVASAPAWAAGGGMPWEGPLSQLSNSITGPVAGSIIAIAIVASGLTMAFAAGQGMRQFAGIIFAGSIVGVGLLFFMGLFGLTAGAVL
jgi:type IV secretory pathway VirB2 component (pilin)